MREQQAFGGIKAMNRYDQSTKKAAIDLRISEFEVPPMQDVLIVGKQAPIGPEAARRMVDILSPDQYDIIKVKHPSIEAVVIRKALYRMLPKEKIVDIMLEEGEKVVDETMIIKMQVNISLQISRLIDL